MIDSDFERQETGVTAWPHWRMSFFATLLARIQHALAVRRDRRLLQELPDFILKDIGISRGSIDYMAVRGGADWRPQVGRSPTEGDVNGKAAARRSA